MQTQISQTQTSTPLDLLQRRREEGLNEMRELFSSYMQRTKTEQDNQFTSFASWQYQQKEKEHLFSLAAHQKLFGQGAIDLQSGGYHIWLEQKGICINPGKHFFEKLCKSGKTLHDIDIVIASQSSEEISQEIELIHSLNRKCNQTLLSYGQEPHLIRFFVHPELISHLSAKLRPEFRNEKNSLVSLETFASGIDVERCELSKELSMSYTRAANENLALRLDTKSLSFGVLCSGGWKETLKRFFRGCSIVLAGIGNTPATDLEKLELQSSSLGYFGLCTLAQELESLELLLLSEFSRSDGDIRLELTKMLHADCPHIQIVPIDDGFTLDLTAQGCKTYASGYVNVQELAIVRAGGAYAPLLYIAKDDLVTG